MRDQRLVGADVGGRLLAADVLLAGGEGEDVAALAVGVHGLADQAARHLAHELFLACDDTAVRPAVADGDAEGLRLQRDDVCLGGRADDAQRDGFGDGDEQQRALGVGDRGDGGDVLNRPEEVGRLDEDAGGLGGDCRIQRGQIDAAIGCVAHFADGNLLVLRVGGEDFAVLGMHGAGDDGAVAAGDADGHHHGLGRAG